jgi:hypothetical protein
MSQPHHPALLLPSRALASPRVRRVAKSPRTAFRLLTSPLRSLPTLLIIGAQKAGTTSLFSWLDASREFLPAFRKEVHYFTVNYRRSERWYRSHFPLRARVAPPRVTGEATPDVFHHPDAPARVRSLVPHARLVLLLRDPVDRAWSHYWHQRRMGREHLGFEDAIAHEPERIRTSWGHRHFSYLTRGLYGAQLARWLDRFPPDRFFVMRSEDLFAEPQRSVDRLCRWLGLSSAPVTPQAENLGTYTEDIDPHTRATLEAYFEQDQARLAQLVERCAPSSR